MGLGTTYKPFDMNHLAANCQFFCAVLPVLVSIMLQASFSHALLQPHAWSAHHSPLPMNFLLVKLNHHLLGLASPSSYTLANNLVANSCLTCDMYCRRTSPSCLSRGGSYIYIMGAASLVT